MIRIMKYGEVPNSEIFARAVSAADVSGTVAEIIARVREGGDKALYDYTARFDGAQLTALQVSQAELDAAMAAVEPEFLRILRTAAENIRAVHSRQVRNSFVMTEQDGIVLGQRVIPIDRVQRW